ncbi:MAG TPA: membrane dipeptidase [Ignavibacteriaceae bacterium]|nr:membrane dipeptidase [Ignavibacteriaceae bacterium]
MRYFQIFIVSFFFFVSSFPQESSVTITGKIKDKTSGAPVSQAKIYINGNSGLVHDSVATNASGNWSYTFPVTSVSENPGLPESFTVSQNYPNPFNPSTKIDVSLPVAGNVIVGIYNALGEKIDGYEEFLNAGFYSIEWNARGSAGVYFFNVKFGGTGITRKMILLDGGYGSGFSRFYTGASSSGGISRYYKSNSQIDLSFRVTKNGYAYFDVDTVVSGSEYFEFSIEKIHFYSRLIDLHNDILEKMVVDTSYHLAAFHTFNHTDIPRMRTGGVDAQFFAVWVDPSAHPVNQYDHAIEMINIFHNEVSLNPNTLGKALDPAQVIELNNQNKIAGILAVEGGHAIEEDLQKLANLYNLGMRYLTITWNNSTSWAVSSQDSRSATVGLSEFGKDVIRALDSLGIMIDVSHTGIKTISDILTVTSNPIVATHSGVRNLRNNHRNLYDNQIIDIANSGGVIGVVFYPPFLGSGSVNVSKVVDHIDYIVNLVGVDHVAVGSDFDGIGNNTVVGLEDISKYPNLTNELINRGYNQEEIGKILGDNIMRVFQQVRTNRKIP